MLLGLHVVRRTFGKVHVRMSLWRLASHVSHDISRPCGFSGCAPLLMTHTECAQALDGELYFGTENQEKPPVKARIRHLRTHTHARTRALGTRELLNFDYHRRKSFVILGEQQSHVDQRGEEPTNRSTSRDSLVSTNSKVVSLSIAAHLVNDVATVRTYSFGKGMSCVSNEEYDWRILHSSIQTL